MTSVPEPPKPPVVPPLDVAAAIADIQRRLAVLEANLTHVEDTAPDPAALDRLNWFVKHGRRRPW